MTFRIAALFVFTALAGVCGDWNPRLAAEYLDGRQKEWFAWPRANGGGMPCVSCHTGETYLLARPALRRALGESEPTMYETGLRNTLRTKLQKGDSSAVATGTYSVLAAVFLGPEAFDHMWSMQTHEGEAKGGWPWFSLKQDPWEMPESSYYGAALAALAVGSAGPEYRKDPRVADLTAYLAREFDSQPLHHRLAALWASTKLPEALPEPKRRALVAEIWKAQQPDGSWTMPSLGQWKEHPDAPKEGSTTAYATAYTAWILELTGVRPADARMAKALAWLRAHQDREHGYWDAVSMNRNYEDPMPRLFMRDAATAFACLALLDSAGI
jgi:hypothetical protein